jgi:hypothetical protein
MLPVLNSSRIELLDHSRLIGQLCCLERRTARGGRDSIDHAPGAHDDVANSVAGAIVTALRAVDHNAMNWHPAIYSRTRRHIPGGGAEPRPVTDWAMPRSW